MASAYLLVVIIVIYFLSKLIKKTGWRWAFRSVLFVLFLFFPFADQILGRYYFDYLCEKEGGLHVFETVELGAEYYHEDGSPRFMDPKGKFDPFIFNNRYEFKRKSLEHYVEIVVIEKDIDSIIDTKTKKVLGEYSRFIYRGGWLANSLDHVGGGVGGSCRGYGYQTTYDGFIKYVFNHAVINGEIRK